MVTHANPWDFMSECTAIFPRAEGCALEGNPQPEAVGAHVGHPCRSYKGAPCLLLARSGAAPPGSPPGGVLCRRPVIWGGET